MFNHCSIKQLRQFLQECKNHHTIKNYNKMTQQYDDNLSLLYSSFNKHCNRNILHSKYKNDEKCRKSKR